MRGSIEFTEPIVGPFSFFLMTSNGDGVSNGFVFATMVLMMFLLSFLCLALLAFFLWRNRSSLYVAAAHRAFRRGDEEGTLANFAKAEARGRLDVQTTVSYAYLVSRVSIIRHF